jgi:HSP20 family protein
MKGHRKVEKENSYEEYKFEKRFTLGRDLDTTKLTANLSDGVLVLTAPKKEKEEPKSTTVPITLGDAPALMDE